MTPKIQLYDTRRREVVEFISLDPEVVRIYTCGPTVYGKPHIGNHRMYIFEDVLVKTLRYFGFKVEWVMNITDVGHLTSDADSGEDKLEVGAKREGITAWDVAKKYEAYFLQDLKTLHIAQPTHLVRATDTILEQIALIKALEEKGQTYRLDDGIYFDASTFPRYAELGRLDIEGLQAGARVEMEAGKRHVNDFALWKFSPANAQRDMEWDSPWGVGFPGWHIECSAIALKELGPELDIHCGGVDHIPVHHTNEIAQSESVTGKRLAQYWCHGEFLLVDGVKISKSLGNVFTLEDLEAKNIDPLALRLFTYSASYRSKLNFSWEALEAAQVSLERLRHLFRQGQGGESDTVHYEEQFKEALADDINLPKAVAVLWEVAKSSLQLELKRELAQKMDAILSLDLVQPLIQPKEEALPKDVLELKIARDEARRTRNYVVSDSLRAQIEKKGYKVLDGPNGETAIEKEN